MTDFLPTYGLIRIQKSIVGADQYIYRWGKIGLSVIKLSSIKNIDGYVAAIFEMLSLLDANKIKQELDLSGYMYEAMFIEFDEADPNCYMLVKNKPYRFKTTSDTINFINHAKTMAEFGIDIKELMKRIATSVLN